MNVNTGTMLRNAHENVADVYLSPRRKRYWGTVTLKNIAILVTICLNVRFWIEGLGLDLAIH